MIIVGIVENRWITDGKTSGLSTGKSELCESVEKLFLKSTFIHTLIPIVIHNDVDNF